jgi:3-dehydroquinate synthase
MSTVRVNLGPRSYDIAINDNDRDLGTFCRTSAPKSQLAFVVGDANVLPHIAAVSDSLKQIGFLTESATVPAGEASKSLAMSEMLYGRLADLNADRATLIVAVGGGVIGDLGGFVAATYNRGLPLLMVPTTLLAMVDSAVGGKVGINLPQGKNLVGAFHQPVGVWIDMKMLDTLPRREFHSGMAEVVKYGVIRDAEFFAWLENNADAALARKPAAIQRIVERCCRLKADIVENDEREETGLRMVLNYGHTFAHCFETAAGYGTWLHGEAVSAGMICASRLAERLGLISSEITNRQVRLLERFGLPVAPQAWPIEELLAVMRRDKKAQAGKLRFVLPRKLGEVAVVDDISEADVAAILQKTD